LTHDQTYVISVIYIHIVLAIAEKGPPWSWSYGSLIYNYLWNQCLSTLSLWVRIPLRRFVLDATLCDEIYQLLAAGRWFSSGTPVSSTNKTNRHDIAEILLKVALNTYQSIDTWSSLCNLNSFATYIIAHCWQGGKIV